MKVTSALSILLLFMIGFNPSTIYALLHGTHTYGNSSICQYLGYWIRDFVSILIFVCFFVSHYEEGYVIWAGELSWSICSNCGLLYTSFIIQVENKVSAIYFVNHCSRHISSNLCMLTTPSIHIYRITTLSDPHTHCTLSMMMAPTLPLSL